MHHLQRVRRHAHGAGAGAALAQVPVGGMAVEVVQVGAHRALQVGKGAHLEVPALGLGGDQADGALAPGTLAEQRVGAQREARGAPAAFLRGLGQHQARRHRVDAGQQVGGIAFLGAVPLFQRLEPERVGGAEAALGPGVERGRHLGPQQAQFAVGLQYQRQQGAQEQRLARLAVFDLGHVARQGGHRQARHAEAVVGEQHGRAVVVGAEHLLEIAGFAGLDTAQRRAVGGEAELLPDRGRRRLARRPDGDRQHQGEHRQQHHAAAGEIAVRAPGDAPRYRLPLGDRLPSGERAPSGNESCDLSPHTASLLIEVWRAAPTREG